ncbi:hypothetical protein CC78DRAFT_518116 [Lojkania enalia]|uniref:Tail specific protease domain-containing protein n=1 Tax=Lojkania enalia TaxID=147567 RepID=A0A9P4K8E8_9PLEO|nr:hypothetical protein CC78DRAFT_518116 [Didymosphaeria enalia]
MSRYPQATLALVPVPAAEDCLKSVNIDKQEDLLLIEELQNYVSWQSNLAYLSEPPKDYNEPRIDVLDEIARVKQDLQDDKYNDEYTLMFDLSMAIQKSYDFHFSFAADILNVFFFRRGNIGGGLLDEFALVSVSEDGKALPKLYNYYDIMVAADEGWKPSPITEINDTPAEEYVQKWSETFPYHEDHARYNRLFPNQASNAMGSRANLFGRSGIPDGNYTVVRHANGTVNEFLNNAIVPMDAFDGVTDGDSFFFRFCNQIPQQSNSKRSLRSPRSPPTQVKRQVSEPTATGYPTPKYLHSEAVIGGYYLDGQGYDDVAVLSIPSFQPMSQSGVAEFQDLIGTFTKEAKAAGKKRLVIDLRTNGGGRVFLGYDAFKQLFPSEDPYGGTTFRANEAFDEIGKLINEELEQTTYEEAVQDFLTNGEEATWGLIWNSMFNYRLPLNEDNENFTSWEDYFGPHERNNDKFTSVARYDLNNFFSDDLNMDITGYRTRASKLNKDQPFEADNIVLLQDGACGSTCAVFSEFMKYQGGVQQVVIGGKPENGPMQGVAGSKGAQVYSFDSVQFEAYRVYAGLPDQRERLNQTDLGSLIWADRPLYRSAWGQTGTISGVNLRDNIRKGDDSVTPLEFVYEAADCRLFYTAEMVRDVEAVWKKTVDARWGDAKATCVTDSVGDASSLSGGAEKEDKKGAATRMGGSTGLVAGLAMVVMALFL